MNRELCMDKLLLAYSHNYTIDSGSPLFTYCVAFGQYHDHVENYVMTKKAMMYATETNDYIFFISVEHLDESLAETLVEQALSEGLKQVEITKYHMCSLITVIILADEIEKKAKTFLKRKRFHKDYKFAIKGWTELRIGAVDLSGKEILANTAAGDVKKTLKKNLLKEL